ncbi:MAG: RES family NAD+ phosphorylase [Cyclobacteriaceae bacterium]
MLIYRICKARYPALDGYGAYLYGGRWNSAGRAVVYAAVNRALAALEFLTGVERHASLGPLLMVTVKLPDTATIQKLRAEELPENWQTYPAGSATKRIGDLWLEKAESLCLQIPSVLIPEEHNMLINPLHQDFRHINIIESKPFVYDERLL